MLREAQGWLERLGEGELSQRDLVQKWEAQPEPTGVARTSSTWLDERFSTEPAPCREASPGITVLREVDVADVEQGRVKAQEVALPMNPPPSWLRGWQSWKLVQHYPVAPHDVLTYDPLRGARWRKP